MTSKITFFALLLYSISLHSQSEVYNSYISKAEEAYQKTDYRTSAENYSSAFRSNGWKGYGPDRYKAAKAWAMAGVPDSAFFNLFRLAEKLNYDNLDELKAETALNSLHQLARWQELCTLVKSNQPSMPDLAKELAGIYESDQKLRKEIGGVEAKYGRNSPEAKEMIDQMIKNDEANQKRVCELLDSHGWMGPKMVGSQGSSALFLVVQHADLKTQEKYLPMMREAVKKGDAQASSLALLEDRVLMRNGKKQIYGSQVRRDPETGKQYFYPIEDVDHVDERRASVGLEPLASYGEYFGIYWGSEAIRKNKEMQPDAPEKQ